MPGAEPPKLFSVLTGWLPGCCASAGVRWDAGGGNSSAREICSVSVSHRAISKMGTKKARANLPVIPTIAIIGPFFCVDDSTRLLQIWLLCSRLEKNPPRPNVRQNARYPGTGHYSFNASGDEQNLIGCLTPPSDNKEWPLFPPPSKN